MVLRALRKPDRYGIIDVTHGHILAVLVLAKRDAELDLRNDLHGPWNAALPRDLVVPCAFRQRCLDHLLTKTSLVHFPGSRHVVLIVLGALLHRTVRVRDRGELAVLNPLDVDHFRLLHRCKKGGLRRRCRQLVCKINRRREQGVEVRSLVTLCRQRVLGVLNALVLLGAFPAEARSSGRFGMDGYLLT